eukprot:COSAG02_NODE_1683_length_11339_cov_976.310409_4_plen_244_part_00
MRACVMRDGRAPPSLPVAAREQLGPGATGIASGSSGCMSRRTGPQYAAARIVRAAWTLVLLFAPRVRSQQIVDADDVAYMQHSEFVKAVSTDDKATVEALLSTEAGKKNIDMADREEGLTALVRQSVKPPPAYQVWCMPSDRSCACDGVPVTQHVAAHNGAVESAKLLIEAGADVNHNKDHEMGYAPLHWAADQGQLRTALVLLMNAANPDGGLHVQRRAVQRLCSLYTLKLGAHREIHRIPF